MDRGNGRGRTCSHAEALDLLGSQPIAEAFRGHGHIGVSD